VAVAMAMAEPDLPLLLQSARWRIYVASILWLENGFLTELTCYACDSNIPDGHLLGSQATVQPMQMHGW